MPQRRFAGIGAPGVPRACIPVQTQQGDLLLCPYFPGCFFNWTSLDQALVENIIEMLAFMDGFVKPSAPQKGAASRQRTASGGR